MRRRLSPPIAAGVLAGLAVPAAVLAAPADAAKSEAEALYEEGRAQYDAAEYAKAAETWTRVLDSLPESEANLATRESLLVNVIQAHIDAHRRQLDPRGDRDIEHLHAGKRVADAYLAQWTATYGEERPIGATVQERIAELDREIEEAKRAAQEDIGPCLQPCLSPPPPPPIRQGCGGEEDLAQTALFGLFAVPAVGRRRKDVRERVAARLPPDVAARLQKRWRREDDGE